MKTKNILGLNNPYHYHHSLCNIDEEYKKFGYITEYERKHIHLLESGHVGFKEYKENVEILIAFIINDVYNSLIKKRHITSDLNKIQKNGKKIQLFPFSEEFLVDFYYTKNYNVSAEYLPKELIIVDGIVKKVHMIIKLPEYMDNIDIQIRRLLYHELLHCKEDIERILHNKEDISAIYMSDKSMINYDLVTTLCKSEDISDYDDRKIMAHLLYRLFVNTERRALVNEVYADLLSIKKLNVELNAQNIKDILLSETEPGQTYVYYRDNILNECKKDKQFVKLSLMFFSKSFKSKFNNFDMFYKWFMRYFETQLQSLFVSICKVAELFILEEFNISKTEEKHYKHIKNISERITNILNEELSFMGESIMYNTYTIPYSISHKQYETNVILEKLKLMDYLN